MKQQAASCKQEVTTSKKPAPSRKQQAQQATSNRQPPNQQQAPSNKQVLSKRQQLTSNKKEQAEAVEEKLTRHYEAGLGRTCGQVWAKAGNSKLQEGSIKQQRRLMMPLHPSCSQSLLSNIRPPFLMSIFSLFRILSREAIHFFVFPCIASYLNLMSVWHCPRCMCSVAACQENARMDL